MTPGSFDLITCKETLGDAACRVIESEARSFAQSGLQPPKSLPGIVATYWDQVLLEMRSRVFQAAYQKRLDRLARQAAK